MGLLKKPLIPTWRFCREEPDAARYITTDARRSKDYEQAKRLILDDPLNLKRNRKKQLLTTKQFREQGMVFVYKIPSGDWRFFYLVDQDERCIDLIWAGPHDDYERLIR